MKSFGLALSGGGFRACLYHLGVVRFLRDAGLLSRISHITSVSGGSVIGAHLALNWDRYCGTDEEFQQVADELLRFLQLDVRNRIIRRFPLASLANFGRRTLRLSPHRQYTRAGLLEQHYEKHLYGDTGLFNLPRSPRLYILATNLSEGSLCAFHRDGMLLQRRSAGGHHRIEELTIGLATVSMAVAASSAFPGFFPPLELRAWEVGAREGEFGRHSFTDGGIYDNIGLRMFRHITQSSCRSKPKPEADAEANNVPPSEDSVRKLTTQTESEGFDGIFVSDAGATFKVQADGRAGGLLSTAMRSSDILMDRVNQLELESFRDTDGVLFFPITQIVKQPQDPYAPHAEIQRQAALIRTDMDRFSDLEISALVQHGYCVAREACRVKVPELLLDCPEGPAWNPLANKNEDETVSLSSEEHALGVARRLQQSSSRRILSTLLSIRDWPTYVWVPLVAALMFTLPYLLYKSNKTATQRGHVLTAIAKTSPLYSKILDLLEDGPVTTLQPVEFDEVDSIEPADYDGFDVLSDDRIFDLRSWTSTSTARGSAPFVHSRLRVRRKQDFTDNTHLRFQSESADEELAFVCRTESLKPRYFRMRQPDGNYRWEVDLDFSRTPVNTDQIVVCEGMLISEFAEQLGNEGRFQFTIFADTALARIWMLMPQGRLYDHFEITGIPIGHPDQSQTIVPTTTVELPIGSIATFQLIDPRHDYRYEVHWKWSDERD